MQAVQAAALLAMRRAWSRVDPGDIGRSWAIQSIAAAAVFSGYQAAAAERGADYIGDALAEQGIGDVDPVGRVNSEALAGVASDGRPLAGLLYAPATVALTRIRSGLAPAAALRSARNNLDRIVRTQIADAGRAAASVGIAARPGVGYVRMLNPPSCVVCVQLAGRYYRYNDGFQRHPKCDCVHVPAREAGAADLTTDPNAYFDSLSPEEQDELMGAEAAQAVRDGADFNQVVNARRGATGVGTTTEGVTRVGAGRLMPDEIYRRARSRDEALSLLRQYGYLI